MIRTGIRRVLNLALHRRDRWEREVEDEIKLHLALRAEQLSAQGMSAEEAYREAVRKFGPLSESSARLVARPAAVSDAFAPRSFSEISARIWRSRCGRCDDRRRGRRSRC